MSNQIRRSACRVMRQVLHLLIERWPCLRLVASLHHSDIASPRARQRKRTFCDGFDRPREGIADDGASGIHLHLELGGRRIAILVTGHDLDIEHAREARGRCPLKAAIGLIEAQPSG